jgi:hypothetical protein
MKRTLPASAASRPSKPAPAPPPKRSLLDVAGYVAALGHAGEAWRICYTCRLGYAGDGSEASQLLLRALATRTRATRVIVEGELTVRCRLSHAAHVGDTNRVVTLVRAGADVHGGAGLRALCEAVKQGHVGTAAALLAAGADPEGVTERWSSSARVPCQPWSFMRPSALRALVPLFLEAGVGSSAPLPRAVDHFGSALLAAAAYGYLAVVRLLLPHYDGPEHAEERELAGQAACWNKRLHTLTLLLDTGAVDASALLHSAVSKHWALGVKLLLAHGADANVTEGRRTTALHRLWGTQAECAAIVAYLLDAGADMEARDGDGRTPLVAACAEGRVDAVRALIEEDADLEARDGENRTPLIVASVGGGVDAVRALLDAGADLEARDDENRTPLFAACACCWPRVPAAKAPRCATSAATPPRVKGSSVCC